jgi:hypothetical protein
MPALVKFNFTLGIISSPIPSAQNASQWPCQKLVYALIQLIQMLQSCQHNLFTRLLNLASQKDLIQDSVYLDHS